MTTENETRPWYMTEDCGKWCRSDHHPAVEIEDRGCYSDGFEVPLSFWTGAASRDGHEPDGFLVNLVKEWREAEPHIDLGSIQATFGTMHLTLKEAERLAYILSSLVNVARDADEMGCIAENLADERQWR